MEKTFKHIIVATSHFVVHKPIDCANAAAVDALETPYHFQWRIIGSTHNATQTREPPRQEDQRLF